METLLSLVWKALLATASYRLSGTCTKVRPLICSGVYKIMKLGTMYHASVFIRTPHTFIKFDTYCASQWPDAYHQSVRVWHIKLPNSFNGYVCCSPCETGGCCYSNMSDIIMLHTNGITWPRYSPYSPIMYEKFIVSLPITWTILKFRGLNIIISHRVLRCLQKLFVHFLFILCCRFTQQKEPFSRQPPSPITRFIGANMGPIWGRQVPCWPRVGPINFAIWTVIRDESGCYYSLERWGVNIYRNIPALAVSLFWKNVRACLSWDYRD